MENIKEVTLELPWDIVDKCSGFGLDVGGSVCKVIYLHKDDWVTPDKRTKETVPLRCINISRTEFSKVLSQLKERVCIRRQNPDHKPVIFTTGVGSAQFSKAIQEMFNVETSNISEFKCFCAAFNYILRNSKRGEIVHETNQDVVQKRMRIVREQAKMMQDMTKDAKNMESPNSDAILISSPLEEQFNPDEKYMDYADIFPCFLVMVGSSGGIFHIKEDGTFNFAADLKRAGRKFVGLASILTNSTSFDEIMQKVERGNMRQIHEYVSDLSKNIDATEQNFYAEIAKNEDNAEIDEVPMFYFGKTVFKKRDEYSDEDLAKSFLYTTIDDLVQTSHTTARLFPRVKHIFWCGGFPNNPLIRDMITESWLERDGISMQLFKQTEFANLHFLKHGSHLGALGSYLNQHLQFVTTPKSKSEEK